MSWSTTVQLAKPVAGAGISRTTFFYYMRTNEVFRKKMNEAKENHIKWCLVSLH